MRESDRNSPLQASPENLQVLELVSAWVRMHGRGPTMREIADGLGVASHTTAQHHVHKLIVSGLLTCDRIGDRQQMASRTLRLTDAGESTLARWRRMQASRLLVGERELALDAKGLEAARCAQVPLDAFRQRIEQGRTILLFADRSERDFWAELVLDELEDE